MFENKNTLTVKEVQEYLGIGQNSIYRLVSSASFPSIRIGRTIRIPKEPFFRWLEDQASNK